VLFNHTPVLHYLIGECGLDINVIEPDTDVDWSALQPRVLSGPQGIRPLDRLIFLACYSTDPCDVVQFLLSAGADVNPAPVRLGGNYLSLPACWR
jgi:hypothetical protein